MKLKEIILEGMYDKLTGQINKDVFKTLKNAIKGSGTQEKPKKFKGYEVRKDPMPMVGTMQDMFQSEKRALYVGDYSDSVSGVDVEVEVGVCVDIVATKRTPCIHEPGNYYYYYYYYCQYYY